MTPPPMRREGRSRTADSDRAIVARESFCRLWAHASFAATPGSASPRHARVFRGRFFSSEDARDVGHWGRATWDALFLLAADYPHTRQCEDDDPVDMTVVRDRRRAWRSLLENLPWLLPCGECGAHFQRYLQQNEGRNMNRALKNRDNLFEFLYESKDNVNRRRGGRASPNLATVRTRYIPACPAPATLQTPKRPLSPSPTRRRRRRRSSRT